MIIPVIYIVVYFAEPGAVEDLFLIPGSHSILVNWKKPTVHELCAMKYAIEWVKLPNININSSNVTMEENSFVIQNLDAGVEYEVVVKAVNVEGWYSGRVTDKTKTERDGKLKHNFFLFEFV
jgi:hypothetical protein